MSTDRDVTRIVRSWLEEGATALPDRVLDTVLDQLPATPQRRAWWPARRFQEMNTYAKVAIAAAAVVVVAVAAIGMSVIPRPGGVGGLSAALTPTAPPTPVLTPAASPTPTPTSSPAPTAASSPEVVLAWPGYIPFEENPAGRYSWDPDSHDDEGRDMREAWMHNTRLGINVWFAQSDKGYTPGPIALTVAGYDATYQTLKPNAEGAVKHVWMVDIEGTTVSITVEASAGTPAADLAEAKAMISSIRLERTTSATGYRLTFDLQAGWDSG